MQPNYQQAPIVPNNFSKALLAKRDAWAESLGIKSDEMLVFVAIGTGNTEPLMIKSTAKGNENKNFEPMKPVPMSHTIPMHESIPDAGAPGNFVQLMYYEGGYHPTKKPSPVVLRGYDETVINVVPEEDPALYDFLTLTPRLVGGVSSSPRVTTKIRLLRPDAEVEADFENEEKQATAILAIRDASIETLHYLAPKLFIATSTFEQRMRKNFSDYVKLSAANVAKVQALFEADETLVYQQVEQAVQANVVAVDPNKQMWVLANNQQPITPVAPGRNALDQLVEYLVIEKDQVILKQILALLGDPEIAASVAAAPRRGGRPPKKS